MTYGLEICWFIDEKIEEMLYVYLILLPSLPILTNQTSSVLESFLLVPQTIKSPSAALVLISYLPQSD